jgi:hypothetical protein
LPKKHPVSLLQRLSEKGQQRVNERLISGKTDYGSLVGPAKMFELPCPMTVRVSDTLGNISLPKGVSIPCIVPIEGLAEAEVVFVDSKMKATLVQTPGLLEEPDCYYVVGSTEFREIF